MFGSLGFTEIAFILVLALLLFGPKRLPEIGRTIGKGLGEFRRASNDLRRTLENEVAMEEKGTAGRPAEYPARPTAVAEITFGRGAPSGVLAPGPAPIQGPPVPFDRTSPAPLEPPSSSESPPEAAEPSARGEAEPPAGPAPADRG